MNHDIKDLKASSTGTANPGANERETLLEQLRAGLESNNIETTSELEDKLKQKQEHVDKLIESGKAQTEGTLRRQRSLEELKKLKSIQEKLLQLDIDRDTRYVNSTSMTPIKTEPADNIGASKEIRYPSPNPSSIKLPVDSSLPVLLSTSTIDFKSNISGSSSSLTNSLNVSSDTTRSLSPNNAQKPEIKDSWFINKLKKLKSSPLSAEKLAAELLAYAHLKKLNINSFEIDNNKINLDEKFINDCVRQLHDRLKTEELLLSVVESKLKAMVENVINNKWTDFRNNCNEIKCELQPFDLLELKDLITEGNNAANLIEEKDVKQEVVLLLGDTGAGKSTTIHHLAGSTLIKDENSSYIRPVNIVNPALAKIITGASVGESQTRFITAVPVDCQHQYAGTDIKLILLDSPGFNDKNGAEVDVANSINVENAVKKCKGVKFLILQRKQGSGNRYEGLINLLNVLSNMMENSLTYSANFIFGFTEYNKSDLVMLHNDFNDLLATEERSNYPNKNYITLLRDIIRKTSTDPATKRPLETNHAVIIDPLHDNPAALLELLSKVPSINNPKNVFRLTVTPKSLSKLIDQAKKYQEGIAFAIKAGEYELAEYRMQQLEWMKNKFCTCSDNFEAIFENCLNSTNNEIDTLYNLGLKLIDKCLADSSTLTVNDTVELEKIFKKLSHLQKTLANFTFQNENKSLKLKDFIIDKSKQLCTNKALNDLNNEDDKVYAGRLDKLEALSKIILEIDTIYRSAIRQCSNVLEEMYNEINQALSTFKFDQFAEVVNKYQSLSIAVTQHSFGLKNKLTADVVRERVLNLLDTKKEELERLLSNVRLSDSDVEQIKQKFNIIESAKDTLKLHQYVPRQEIDKIYQSMIQVVIKNFEDSHKTIASQCLPNTKTSFDHVKYCIEHMDKLRKIPILEFKTAQQYYASINLLSNYIRTAQLNIEKEITTLSHPDKEIDTHKLTQYLNALKSAAWLDEKQPGAYEFIEKQIKDELTYRLTELKKRGRGLSLDIKHHNNLVSAKSIINRIEDLSELDKLFDGLEKLRSDALMVVFNSISNTLNKIKTRYNIEKMSLEQFKVRLKLLEEIKKECDANQPYILFLKKNGFNDFDQLELSIKNNEIELEEYEETKLLEITQATNAISDLENIKRVYASEGNAKYLFSKGYKNIQQVDDKIKSEQDKIALLNKPNEKLSHLQTNIQKLRSIRQEYLNLRESMDVSEEMRAILTKNAFSSMHELISTITEQKKMISRIETYGQQNVVVDHLDFIDFADCFNYLTACSNNISKSEIHKEVEELKHTMEKYARAFGSTTEREVSKCFESLQPAPENAHEYSNILVNIIGRISQEREDHNEVVNICFANRDILSSWNRQLLLFYNQVEQKISELVASGQMNQMRSYLHFIKALTWLDNLLNQSNNFSKLYEINYSKYQEKINVAGKEISDSLKKQIYRQIPQKLEALKTVNPNQYEYSKEEVIESIKQLIKSARSLLNNIDDVLKDAKVNLNPLVDHLTQIQDIVKHLRDFLEKSDNHLLKLCTEFSQEATSSLTKKLEVELQNIQGSIENNNLHGALTSLRKIRQICSILGDKYEQKAIDKLIAAVELSIENMTKRILKEFIEMPIGYYMFRSPAEVCKNLEATVKDYPSYNQLKADFERVIFKRINDEIAQIKNDSSISHRTDKLREIQSIVEKLPSSIINGINAEIQKASEEIKLSHSKAKELIQKAVANNDINAIDDLVVQYKATHAHEWIMEINNTIREKFKFYIQKINEWSEKNTIISDEILTLIEDMHRYSILFKKDVCKDLLSVYEQLQSKFVKKVTVSFNQLIAIINQNAQLNPKIPQSKALINEASALTEWLLAIIIAWSKNQTFNGNFQEFLPKDFSSLVDQFNKELSNVLSCSLDYYVKGCELYVKGEPCVDSFKAALKYASLWEPVSNKIKPVNVLSNDFIYDIIRFNNRSKEYKVILDEIKTLVINDYNYFISFDYDKIHKDSENKKDKLYTEFNKKYNVLNEIILLLKAEYDDPTVGINLDQKKEQLHSVLLEQIKKMDRFIKEKAPGNNLSKNDYDEINRYLGTLLCISKTVDFLKVKAQEGYDCGRDIIFGKVNHLLDQAKQQVSNLDVVCRYLIEMKKLSDRLLVFRIEIDNLIDDLLKIYKETHANDTTSIAKLGTVLQNNKTDQAIAHILLEEHKCFKGYAVALFNDATQKYGIEHVLKCISDETDDNQSHFDKKSLERKYEQFDRTYKGLVSHNLSSKTINLQIIIDEILHISNDLKKTYPQKNGGLNWTEKVIDAIPYLMAHIFALWTLSNAEHFFNCEEDKEKKEASKYLLKPHAAQVIAIFRMLGIGYGPQFHTMMIQKGLTYAPTFLQSVVKNAFSLQPPNAGMNLFNNFIQIGTGEGKSVTLAVVASVLGLLDMDVSVACYSDYLSQRDFKDFEFIFDKLNLLRQKQICYGTFNHVCEEFLKEKGDIRERITNVFMGSKNKSQLNVVSARPKILLIDEVDVFFSKDFYGNVYSPSTLIKHDTIKQLIDYIWSKRLNKLTFSQIKQTEEYKACCKEFKNWTLLIDEAVKEMLSDVTLFNSTDYIVQNDKIGYKEQDGISFNVTYGYKTLFAYYYEYEKDNTKISQASLLERIGLIINCGAFSYADIPNRFDRIMGVSGTLQTLSDPEKTVIKNEYNINVFTYMPSVFGDTKFKFAGDRDINIVTDKGEGHFKSIREEINIRVIGKQGQKRAVLVVFETQKKLEAFLNSSAMDDIRNEVHVITEELSDREKAQRVKEATSIGQITLITKVFGRGTNFICRDDVVKRNGGVHVISTFLSAEVSEEVQIKGRTARQGDEGTFSMVLFADDLERFQITRDDVKAIKEKDVYYTTLDKKRRTFFVEQYKNDMQFVQKAKQQHEETIKFISDLDTNNLDAIRKFLLERNKGPAEIIKSRTICLMDATGSMYHLLNNAKNTVGTMFDRATVILEENGLPQESFQLQFAVYRNYNCDSDKLLEFSPWETRPANLRNFMASINVNGGLGNEAIEIGLWHVNQESEQGNVTQVILIGDAPAQSKQEVVDKRQNNKGEQYWGGTRYKNITDYKTEVEKIKAKKIPVYAFYVLDKTQYNYQAWKDRLHANFKEIASSEPAELDIYSSTGANKLTDVVTEAILKNVGGDSKGDVLVQAYRNKFNKSHL